MAEKEKKNRVLQYMYHEHKYENLILIVLALFSIELGVLLLVKDLTISENAFLIGEYWAQFAWILVILGTCSLLLGVSSFYRPSFSEIKHVTGLKKREFIGNVIIVICFSIIVALLFVCYDAAIEAVSDLISKIF